MTMALKQSPVFVQQLAGYSVSNCLKTADNLHLDQRLKFVVWTACVCRVVEPSCLSLQKAKHLMSYYLQCRNFCLAKKVFCSSNKALEKDKCPADVDLWKLFPGEIIRLCGLDNTNGICNRGTGRKAVASTPFAYSLSSECSHI